MKFFEVFEPRTLQRAGQDAAQLPEFCRKDSDDHEFGKGGSNRFIPSFCSRKSFGVCQRSIDEKNLLQHETYWRPDR